MRQTSDSIVFSQAPRGFIVLEGVNGAGKSTLLRKIVELCQAKGWKTRATFEPGDSQVGAQLRRLALGQDGTKLLPLSEAFVFAADRHEHIETVVRPALSAGEIVVCDRFLYSTLAFQGYGRGLPIDFLNFLNEKAIGGLVPDLVILLDLDPQVGLARARRRSAARDNASEDVDQFEAEELAFHTRLRMGFLELADHRNEPFLVLDSAQDEEIVFGEAAAAVHSLLACLEKT